MVELSINEIKGEIEDIENYYYYCCSMSTLIANNNDDGCMKCPYYTKIDLVDSSFRPCRKYEILQQLMR